jgi:hypothetical protein
MYVHTDFPYGQAFDANDMAAAKGWWGPGDSPWVRANIITDTQGNAVDTDGTSNGLTGGADRALLAALRAVADVVVMGGATVTSRTRVCAARPAGRDRVTQCKHSYFNN